MNTIDFLQKVKDIRPTTEKIYNSIRKELNDSLDMVKYKTNINIDYLIDNSIVEVRGGGEQEPAFTVERTKENSEEAGELTIRETNIKTEIQKHRWYKKRRKYRNYAGKCWHPL